MYLKYPSKTSALEDVDFVLITFNHLPRLHTSRLALSVSHIAPRGIESFPSGLCFQLYNSL